MNVPLHREMPEGTLDSVRALNDVTQARDRCSSAIAMQSSYQ